MAETPLTDDPETGYRAHYAEHQHNRELCRSLERRAAALEEALRWYQQEAEAMAKYLPAKNAEAVTAICTLLSLDAGNRAKRALLASDTTGRDERMRQIWIVIAVLSADKILPIMANDQEMASYESEEAARQALAGHVLADVLEFISIT